jgi:hypothetical protein
VFCHRAHHLPSPSFNNTDPRCAVPSALARLRRFEWAVGSKRANGRYDAKSIAMRVAGSFPANATLCITVPGEDGLLSIL